ncbi:hypothetical protein EHS13_14910 [Paenibacillus psychroresistens]|uniref:Glycoside hydrolase n=2 Tax=Paenibacillus psychroresistens TaxID=1778678 RepID=A0A6B8RKF6_9BACL|nr:hypothetical protein EHS13_14910 [Paenibacillus psychroresistens]
MSEALLIGGFMKKSQLINQFNNPPVEYRSVPFWSWNSKLEQDELDRQVDGFKAQGMGGFMMHVREGLETPYLGEEFIDRIKETVNKAKSAGMYAWLYDEDRYSSGMAGGKVPHIGGDDVRAKALTLLVCESFEVDDLILAVYEAKIVGEDLVTYRLLEETEIGKHQLPIDHVYLVFRREISRKSDWCHGDTYIDILNPRSTEIFLETTYEVYKQAIGAEFGQTVPGIFTDEPSIRGFSEQLDDSEITWISWTDRLPTVFREKRGYEIWSLLPYFFFNGEHSAHFRHDYWHTITELFSEAYTKQIWEWCQDSHLQFTGHFHSEGHLAGSVKRTGAVMPHYRYMDIPGIDTLCEQTNESLTVKQVSSVANQYGLKRVISETYGVTGWDFTFEGRRWLGDWQFVLGVNLLTHHLALYTISGCRKRDYPPSFNYNVNWWEHNHVLEDYYARLGAVLSEGAVVREVLVVHPTTSIWARMGEDVKSKLGSSKASESKELNEYDDAFNRFINTLLGEHYDFDLGDELIIEESGGVEGSHFIVNKAKYKVVVLPMLYNLLGSTLSLLTAYLESGGYIIAVGEIPTHIDGKVSDEWEKLTDYSQLYRVEDCSQLVELLETIIPRQVSITNVSNKEDQRFLYMRRELTDSSVVFIVNNDRDQLHDVDIRLTGYGSVEAWDLLSGKVEELTVTVEEGHLSFVESYGPTDSKLYVIDHSRHPLVLGANDSITSKAETEAPICVTEMEFIHSYTRNAPNVLVLDRCQYAIDEDQWSDDMEVWQAQAQFRSLLDMRQVYANGILQRYFWVNEPHKNNGTAVKLRFSFEVAAIPKELIRFVFEQVERFEIHLNGELVQASPQGWFLDRSMGTVELPGVRIGNNELIVSCAYTHDMEIEDGFLIGDFAINSERQLIEEPNGLHYGDWGVQGYPHYCGSMIYHFEIPIEDMENKKYKLEMGEYKAVTINLKVNGIQAKAIPWRAAGHVDLSPWLVKGDNRLDIEVVGSPRNMLGPLHQKNVEQNWLDWWSFHPPTADATADYRLVPYGLMQPIRISESLL